MRHILHSTYYLAAAGLLGLITLPALAQEAGTDANESHQAGIAANTESPLAKDDYRVGGSRVHIPWHLRSA
ncbi:hypothetical protein HAALTHF_53320n [Vreelandella aquamarina]|nr:hypothetical protein HAALTHF_53320n [Halomonas axialensis]